MFLQEILEVVIGLVFMWLVLSIAVMQIQEWIKTALDKRAKDLEEAIGRMLADPKLTAYFYDHALIRGLTAKEKDVKKGKRPAYIPAQQFSQVLFDVIMKAGTEASLLQQGLHAVRQEVKAMKDKGQKGAARESLDALLQLARQAEATEAGKNFTRNALIELRAKIDAFARDYPVLKPVITKTLQEVERTKGEIEKAYQGAKPAGKDTILEIRRGVIALSVISPELQQTMSTLLSGAEGYIAKGENAIVLARTNVENWFNASMDRLGGVFKRNAQWWSFGIGMVLAILLNVDTFTIATQMWREPALRQALVANAEDFYIEHPEGVEIPEGGIAPSTAVQAFREEFNGLNIPVGWTFEQVPDGNCSFLPGEGQVFGFVRESICYRPGDAEATTNGIWWVVVKILGWLVSALAALHGAPFWFDILRKLINVRGTGAKPEEKKAETSAAK
jgi:hypothetical protein